MNTYFYRVNLPHWQPPQGTFFITYRLAGSIPVPVMKRLSDEYHESLKRITLTVPVPPEQEMELIPPETRHALLNALRKKKYTEWKRYFKKLDDFLDEKQNDPHWLAIPSVAELVKESIHHRADRQYKLWAYTIMSNHVHILLTMLPNAPMLWKVLQEIKKYSGRSANQLLGLSGQFWERESYDHLVRDGTLNGTGEFDRILWYILRNPVKAGLVKDWQLWPHTYCNPELGL